MENGVDMKINCSGCLSDECFACWKPCHVLQNINYNKFWGNICLSWDYQVIGKEGKTSQI